MKKPFLSTLVPRALDYVERTGNKLPHPVTLFAILIGVVLAASWIAGMLGASAVHPGTGQTISAVNLLNAAGLRRILTEMVSVFAAFPPLGLVLVVMLGIGVAEHSGLVAAGLKAFVGAMPRVLITFTVVTAGMLSSLAVDAGYVVLVPLGAVIFHGMADIRSRGSRRPSPACPAGSAPTCSSRRSTRCSPGSPRPPRR
jgi:aminobenzoyl-glutamate transport protein